jgi:hypothetical protein
MSKNIDEIVESVLPLRDQSVSSEYDEGAINQNDEDRESLKQALTEKKLVVPMSEEKIYLVLSNAEAFESYKDLAKTIYQAQFKESK